MAAQLNSIGGFSFLEILGFPEREKMQLEPVMRPGIDGVGIWELGTRGTPFPCRTIVDAPDVSTALATFAAYADLIGEDPQTLVWRNVAIGGYRYQVLDVR